MKNILYVLLLSIITTVNLFGQHNNCKSLVGHVISNDLNLVKETLNFDSCCVNYVDSSNHGKTPLMYAIEEKKKRVINELLDKGANLQTLTFKTVPRYDAFYIAVNSDFVWGVRRLVKEGFDYKRILDDNENATYSCARNNSVKTLRYLVKIGLDLNHSDDDFFGFGSANAIQWAAMKNNPKIINILISNGVDIEQKGSFGYTPLMSACSAFEPANDAIKFLLKKGANPNCKTSNGYSALMLTCSKNNLIGSKLLIKNGANLNFVTDEGLSALHYCLNNYKVDKDLLELLIFNGIDKTTKNDKGQTGYNIAIEKNLGSEILELLK